MRGKVAGVISGQGAYERQLIAFPRPAKNNEKMSSGEDLKKKKKLPAGRSSLFLNTVYLRGEL